MYAGIYTDDIEGTEFEIEAARDIVVHGRPLQYREDDSHDILGTYQAIRKSKADSAVPQSFEVFAAQLQEWNRPPELVVLPRCMLVLAARPRGS